MSNVPGNAVKASEYKGLVCCIHPELFTGAINAGRTICCVSSESDREAANVTPLSVHRKRLPVF